MKETTTARQDTRHATEREIQRKRREEDDASRKRENDRLAQQSMNIAMGDITGSGIPGGFDLDITTPL